jgi:predicted dehydrogenase
LLNTQEKKLLVDSAREDRTMNPEPVAIAVVGIGRWGMAMSNALVRSKAFKIVTCYTRTKAKRDQFSAEFHCDQESSYEDVLKRKDVEAVVLTTPNSGHAEQTVQASEHGKHVLVEKPISSQISGARRMIEACRKNGVVLAVAHEMRRLAGYRQIKALVESGTLGKIVMAEHNSSHNAGLRMTPQAWRWYEEECPGGPLLGMGVHGADSLQYLLGPVQSVSAFSRRLILQSEAADVGNAIFEFESGALGYLASNYVTPWVNFCNIYGTEANLYFSMELPARRPDEPIGKAGEFTNKGDHYSELYIKRKGEDQKNKVDLKFGEILVEQVKEFADCIRNGKTPEVGGEEALRALAVILAAVRSARSGKPVKVAEVLSEP